MRREWVNLSGGTVGFCGNSKQHFVKIVKWLVVDVDFNFPIESSNLLYRFYTVYSWFITQKLSSKGNQKSNKKQIEDTILDLLSCSFRSLSISFLFHFSPCRLIFFSHNITAEIFRSRSTQNTTNGWEICTENSKNFTFLKLYQKLFSQFLGRVLRVFYFFKHHQHHHHTISSPTMWRRELGHKIFPKYFFIVTFQLFF